MSFLLRTKSKYPYAILDTAARVGLFAGIVGVPLFFLPFTRDQFDLPKGILMSTLALVCFLLWVLRGAAARELYIRRSVLDTPILVFLGAIAVSSVLSIMPAVSWFGRTNTYVLSIVSLFGLALWFWLVVQFIRTYRSWRICLNLILVSGLIAGLLYILHQAQIPWLTGWLPANVVGERNSYFGIFMAQVGILAAGFLIDKRQTRGRQILSFASLFVAVWVLLRLGFMINWIVFSAGLLLLLAVGMLWLADVRQWTLSGVFFLFLVSVYIVLGNGLQMFRDALPVEIALGSRPSLDIATETLFTNTKHFLVGSGMGTFQYDFSKFRSEGFNLVQGFWANRFFQPYNVPLSLLAETGILGFLSFVFLLLFHIGTMISAWLKARYTHSPVEADPYASVALAGGEHLRRLEVFAVAITWLTATIGLGVAFYSVTMWFMWWLLLALSTLGLVMFAHELIREHTVLLDVSPQYSLAASFALVVTITAILFFGVSMGRMYMGETAYTQAVRSSTVASAEAQVHKALEYRPRYAEYRLALAGYYFEQAKAEAAAAGAPERAAERLSAAVNEAKHATEIDPHNVETWEALSLMYLNARVFAAEANTWAKDAVLQGIALEPTNPVLHWRLGMIHEFAGNFKEAAEAYQKSTALKPDFLAGYISLSQLYENQSEIDKAIEIYERIQPLIEQDPELLFQAGRLYYNRNGEGDMDRAERVFLRSVELLPSFSNALYSLGLMYERKGDRAAARDYFERVQALNPDNADIEKKLRSL